MEPYVGEIRMFAGNFAPAGWAFCAGQTLSIAEYSTLFALIGTTYGGDGQTTFRLPDLRGRVPVHQGQNPQTGTLYTMGQAGGAETVTLLSQHLPAHTHAVQAVTGQGDHASPENALWATSNKKVYGSPGTNGAMAANAVAPAGGNLPHSNIMPYQCINFIIALDGIFPSQE